MLHCSVGHTSKLSEDRMDCAQVCLIEPDLFIYFEINTDSMKWHTRHRMKLNHNDDSYLQLFSHSHFLPHNCSRSVSITSHHMNTAAFGTVMSNMSKDTGKGESLADITIDMRKDLSTI